MTYITEENIKGALKIRQFNLVLVVVVVCG